MLVQRAAQIWYRRRVWVLGRSYLPCLRVETWGTQRCWVDGVKTDVGHPPTNRLIPIFDRVEFFQHSPFVRSVPSQGIRRMSFRRDFFDEIRSMNPALPMSSRDSVFLNTIDRGLTAQHREMGLIRQEIESSLAEAADRYAEASDDASQTIASEIAYQAEQNRQAALEASREISWSIDQARVYLGAQNH